MKLFRQLLLVLGLAAALAVLVAAVVFSPTVQTWYARRALARHPDWQATVGSVWAGWSKVDVQNLRTTSRNVSFYAPSLRLELPVARALRDGRLPLRRLIAKDWVMKVSRGGDDAGGVPVAGSDSTGGRAREGKNENAVRTEAAQAAARVWAGILGAVNFPCDVSAEAVEIEGDVIIAPAEAAAGNGTTVHVVLTGGPLAVGRAGAFSFETMVIDARLPARVVNARGELHATMKTARTIDEAVAKGAFAVGGGRPGASAAEAGLGFEMRVDRTAAHGENYFMEFARDGRPIAQLTATWNQGGEWWSGNWEVSARATDIAMLKIAESPPAAIEGKGTFQLRGDFGEVEAAGEFHAGRGEWPWAGRLGAVSVDGVFDVARRGSSVQVKKLGLTIAGAQPIAEVRALQPFGFDGARRALSPVDAENDWLEVKVRGWPLRWFTGESKILTVAGGDVRGELTVRPDNGGVLLRTRTPLTVSGVAVSRGERGLARDLALTLDGELRADAGGGGWEGRVKSLAVASGGKLLGRIEGKLTQPAAKDEPMKVAGKWTADLAAIASCGTIPDTQWLTAREASGEISGTWSGYADLLCGVKVVGHDPSHTLSGKVRAEIDTDGSVAITAPLMFEFGTAVSDLSVDWKWRSEEAAAGVDVELKGKDVGIEHLRLLGPPLLGLGRAREAGPFWGDWIGKVRVDIERLRLADRELIDVGGYFKIGADEIELLGGRGGPPQHSLRLVEGKLTFEASRERPYELKMSAGGFEVEAQTLFATLRPAKKQTRGRDEAREEFADENAAVVGRFTVERSVTASGRSLAELIAGRTDVFKITGVNGVVRRLKTGVAQTLPSAPESSGVVNALDNVGTGFMRLLGANTKSLSSGQVKVSANTEAVLDFDNALGEIGYDKLTFTATRGPSGALQIESFEMTSPELRISGAGRLEAVASGGLLAQPIDAEISLAVRGRLADLLKKAGLLGEAKEAADYRVVAERLHVGGTLARIDQTELRAKLAEAATRKLAPAPEKKK